MRSNKAASRSLARRDGDGWSSIEGFVASIPRNDARCRRATRIGRRFDRRSGSALRELRRSARAAQAVFLAFLHAAVARRVSALAKRRRETRVVGFERAGQAEADGARLTMDAAAVDVA